MSDEAEPVNGNGSNGDSALPVELVTAQQLMRQFRSLQSDILLARSQFMRQAGITFDGKRDEYEIFGYDRIISNQQYRDEYARGGIAGRVVDVMPDATWRGDPAMELIEDENPDVSTPFEKAWEELETRLQICAKFNRVDKLSRLSTYAVLLIGAPGDLETELPKGTPDQLLYLMPFTGGGGPGGNTQSRTAATDADCTIASYDTDANSPRFGLPLSYQLKRTDIASPMLQRGVHWTRILHVAEGLLDDEVFGQPALERIWNLLIDLRKITGGGSEAFWLRANQGLHLDVDKDMQLADVKDTIDKLKEQADAYKHQLTRWLRTRGVNVQTLGSDVANFQGPADAILTQIAGAKAIPKRILTGSEMGELASSQDRENFRDQIVGRQMQYAGPYIVRPLANRFIQYGYLPTPKGGPQKYNIRWSHTQVLTEQEKVQGAQGWASVNATMGTVVFTDDEIREKWADREPLTDEQKKKALEDQMAKAKMAQEIMASSEPPPGGEGETEEEDAANNFAEREVTEEEEKERTRQREKQKPDVKKVENPFKKANGNPFARRAAMMVEDQELLRVLEAAIITGNTEVVDRIIGLQHKYGSTQVQLPAAEAAGIFALAATIPEDDLYEPEGGRETDAHITVKYGLIDPDPNSVKDAIAGRGPVAFTLGQTGVFSHLDYDVVYVAVNSPDLGDLHTKIASGVLCAPSDYDTYRPHATVAYVKSGRGVKYSGMTALDGLGATINTLMVSDIDGNKTEIPLA